MATLLNPDEAATAVGFGDTVSEADDELLTLVHPLAEAVVEDYLGYRISVDSYTEYLPAEAVGAVDFPADEFSDADTVYYPFAPAMLVLRNRPVRSVTSVKVNEAAHGVPADFASTAALAASLYHFTASGVLVLNSGVWPDLPGTVQVAYEAGRTSVELADAYGAIKLAVMLTLAEVFREFKANQKTARRGVSGPMTSERWPNWAATYAQNAPASVPVYPLPRKAMAVLEPHVSYARR